MSKDDTEKIRLQAQIFELTQIISILMDRLRMLKEAVNKDKILWHPFKSGRGEWAYSDKLPKLRETLIKHKARNQKYFYKDGYNYRLSGDEDRFIQRYKTEKGVSKYIT
ncbi:MAG: hypothetical protein ACTSVA_00930 [Candidatus Njordarchaeales archaeon]